MTEHATAPHLRSDLSIDQKLALKTAATRLQNEFADMFGVETIERFLHSSYDQFATRASVPNFLPLLAERFARYADKLQFADLPANTVHETKRRFIDSFALLHACLTRVVENKHRDPNVNCIPLIRRTARRP